MSRLLIVDDEERIRDIIKKYAQFEGFETVEAVDGLQAVEICRKESFDLIIMDVMMPELDGFSAVREIRKTSSTPVLMLSARGEEYDKIHGFELGIDDYVVKRHFKAQRRRRGPAGCGDLRRPDRGFYRQAGIYRRQAGGHDPQGIRPVFLFGEE